jgi:hypothetical protein
MSDRYLTSVFLVDSDRLQLLRHLCSINESTDRNAQTECLHERLTHVFTRRHLDGLKIVLQAMGSPAGKTLLDYLHRIEQSRQRRLTDREQLIVESFIDDHLSLLVRPATDHCRIGPAFRIRTS